MASVSVFFEQVRSQALTETTDTLRSRWRQFTADVTEAALTKTVEHELAMFGVMLEALSVFAQVAGDDEWRASMPNSLTDSGSASDFRYFFEFGFYHWLASRRPLEPLVHLDARLREHYDLQWFPAAPLHSASPREAVARLSEPERVLVREQLERHKDRQGLAALALEAKR
jgi:hypothetical protein